MHFPNDDQVNINKTMPRLELQLIIADCLEWKEARVIVLVHEPTRNLLEKISSTESMLGGEVLAMCEVTFYQAVNQETPLKIDNDDDRHPVIVSRGVSNESFDMRDR